MAETKKSESSPKKATLGPASESVDPAVHQLLAERDIASRNGEKDAVDAATAKLTELGYK